MPLQYGLIAFCLFLLTAAAPAAHGATAHTSTAGLSFQPNGTYGFECTVGPLALQVTALGIRLPTGSKEADGTLLASTFASGSDQQIITNYFFRDLVTSVIPDAGENYVVGARVTNVLIPQIPLTDVAALNPAIELVQGRHVGQGPFGGTTVAFPSGTNGTNWYDYANFGFNTVVPLPPAFVMLGSSLLAPGAMRRRSV